MTHVAPINERLGKVSKKDPLNPSNAGVDYTYGCYGLVWHGTSLRLGGGKRARSLLSIERDATYSWMWRVRLPTGRLTDRLNLTRAKDYACATALRLFDLQRADGAAATRALPTIGSSR
jgi:hypothetical protein